MNKLRNNTEISLIKISIITVCLNCDKLLKKTIKSVGDQTYGNIEYIIIDGGSKDKTCQIIEEYIDYVDIFISKPDLGIFFAMNNGLVLATGDLIYFLNAGDFLYNQYVIENVIKFYNNYQSDIIYGDYISCDGKISILHNQQYKNPLQIVSRGGINHQSLFARKWLFSSCGGFKTKYRIYGDHEWLLKCMLDKKARMQYIGIPIVCYQEGGKSQINPNRYYYERLQIINKYSQDIFTYYLIKKNFYDFCFLIFIILFLVGSSWMPEKLYKLLMNKYQLITFKKSNFKS